MSQLLHQFHLYQFFHQEGLSFLVEELVGTELVEQQAHQNPTMFLLLKQNLPKFKRVMLLKKEKFKGYLEILMQQN